MVDCNVLAVLEAGEVDCLREAADLHSDRLGHVPLYTVSRRITNMQHTCIVLHINT